MQTIHDLDESVQESFEFKLFGKNYRFRHLNTEEQVEMKKQMKLAEQEGNDTAFQEFLYPFITPIEAGTPEFKDVAGKMIGPHWRNFTKMIKQEAAS